MDKKLITKLVGIFTLIAAILAIPQFFIQYKEYKSEHGGHLSMYFMNNEIHNNEVRNIYICVSNSSESLSGISITPVFDNSSEYTIKDFDLRYTLESDGFLPQSNSLYEQIAFDNNSCMYKYQEKTLPQFSQTHEPFRLSSFPKVNSRYTLKAKATYSGAPCPYKYQVNVWIRVYPRKSNQSFDDWKMTCKQQLYQLNSQASVYDAFYASGDKFYHEFGNDFGPQYAASQNTQNTTSKPVQQATTPSKPVQQTTTPAPVTTPAKPVAQTKPVQQTTTPVSADEPLRIVSWEQTTQDSVSYLNVQFNKKTYVDNAKIIVYSQKPYDRYQRYWPGNRTYSDVAQIKLYSINEKVQYVCLPERKDSLMPYIQFRDSAGAGLIVANTASVPVYTDVELKKEGSRYNRTVYCISLDTRHRSTLIHDFKADEVVKYETYLIPRYEGETQEKEESSSYDWLMFLMMFCCFTCYGVGFGILWDEDDSWNVIKKLKSAKADDTSLFYGIIINLALGTLFLIIIILMLI